MARAVAFVPDLLFGSNVVGMLQAGGHDPVLVSSAADLAGALDGADVLIVDLTADADERIAAVQALPVRPPTLAFYAHVEHRGPRAGAGGRFRARGPAFPDGARRAPSS